MGGFTGKKLAQFLFQHTPNHDIHGTVFKEESSDSSLEYATSHRIDLADEKMVYQLIRDVQPDRIFHLAAQSFVPISFTKPWNTIRNNTQAQLNVFEACRANNLKPKILVTSSADIYGNVSPEELPITENSPLRPLSPYAVSKITQDLLAYQYRHTYKWHIVTIRQFNHTGPGQNDNFVIPAFAKQIAQIEAGLQDRIIKVGDLSAQRDFTDVRDVVRAYHLLLDSDETSNEYNLASGKAHSIQHILDLLIAQSTRTDIIVETDPELFRPSPSPILVGDCSRLRQAIGWQPEIPIEQTVTEILDFYRERFA